jgi:hypothetical protein
MQSGYICDKNIVANAYNHGGTQVTITTNTEKMGRTAREMAEVQRDSYESLAENLAAAQRRGIGLANDGLEFMKLQEDNARAAREWFANGVKLLKHQQRNAEFVQGWMGDAIEVLREQSEHNVRTAEAFGRSVSKQQEGYRALTQLWVGAYRNFFSPFSYMQEGLRTAQRATGQGLQATEQVAQQGLRVAEEATEQTEEILRRTEEATRQAELRTAVLSALKSADYDGLTVEEISKRLDSLSAEQLRNVREFEEQNKNRETLIEQIERKIRVKNS